MAKNYTFAEAVKIINEGTDMEAIIDIGRRFPGLLHKVTKVTTKAGNDFVELMSYLPEHLTANKVNTAIKNVVGGSAEDDDDAEDADETSVKENAKEETEASNETVDWNESMSAKQLWDLLGKAGKRKVAKSTKKADLVEACKQVFGVNANDEDEAEDEADNEDNPYEGKSAMELFKECKKRGIKAAPKKPAKFYADLLIKADAETAETDSDDEWEENESEAETKKPEKKEDSKKPAKADKKEEAADDDEDWDI